MKLVDSYLSRRDFLRRLMAGWAVATVGVIAYPLARYLAPVPSPDPDWVVLPAADFLSIPPNSAKIFAYGRKMGIVLRTAEGEFRLFKGVCTHLDCNVTYRPEERKFFCACHQGWFDDSGRNIAGPPPRPLTALGMKVAGDRLIVLTPGGKTPPPEVTG